MSAIVIIPTYNERDNLVELTERLLGLPLALDVTFVDDNSPDGTGKLADELARSHPQISVIRRERKLGYGSAVIEGFRAAMLGRPLDWISLGISASSAAALTVLGVWQFRRMERAFADTV